LSEFTPAFRFAKQSGRVLSTIDNPDSQTNRKNFFDITHILYFADPRRFALKTNQNETRDEPICIRINASLIIPIPKLIAKIKNKFLRCSSG
jgi:hypothetical protein